MRNADVCIARGEQAFGFCYIRTPLEQVGGHADGNDGRLRHEWFDIEHEEAGRGAGQQGQRMLQFISAPQRCLGFRLGGGEFGVDASQIEFAGQAAAFAGANQIAGPFTQFDAASEQDQFLVCRA